MDVGIIAACLIVMRPCFEAIHNAVRTSCRFPGLSSARSDSDTISSRVASALRDKGVVRTVVLELESQPGSTRVVTPKDLL
ncbi:hypothetical protein HO173_005074 [Letharia columbiana]|uniref:Uncharacterized protein n=1 Tax=Letharia columbiana TaxID=112416 RepID=A0A8H6L5V3_9LECA|nr:uncharacterized protein HO173_005074 [Letharia columbiana]KAF6236783.1 hypothetical protein HO173_005074 [Letharia columbiana]